MKISCQEVVILNPPGEMDVEDRESPCEIASDSCGLPSVHLSTGEDSDEDFSCPETSNEDGAALSHLDWLEELYEFPSARREDHDDVDGDGDLAVAAVDGEKRRYAETARMFKLRRNLDQLDCFHRQKERDVLKAREELKLCCHNIESLVEHRDNLEREIERQRAADDSVAVFRLRSQHKHLCQELQTEEELEGHINTGLKQQELVLREVEVELGRFSSLRQEVQEEQRLFQAHKNQKTSTRLQQERKASQNLQLKMQHLKQKQAVLLKTEEAGCQTKIEEGRANHKIACNYLKETIRRMQRQEAEKQQQRREFLEKRIQAVNSLKSNIAATQESLRLQQSRARVNAQKEEVRRRQLRESLEAQGINSIKHMYQQKQVEEIKRKQAEFEERQKSKRVEIVAKILQEERQVKSRRRHRGLPPKPSTCDRVPLPGRAGETLLRYLAPRPPSDPEERATPQLIRFSDVSSSSSASSDVGDLEETVYREEDHRGLADSLAEPEFSGLWDQNHEQLPDKKMAVAQTEVKQKDPALAGGALNIPAKKMRGPPFISKPEVIFFKDFEVGIIYKQKIVLTNVSYVTNYCKLLGVSARLKDFLSINFEPPGSLSTGMSCDMQAVFQPTINEDLKGEVHFVSALGPFSVPVRCTIKKCELEVDGQFIDFGSHVVGQTISRIITLTNKGALATLFSLDTSSCLIPETSRVQTASNVSANTCQENRNPDTTSEGRSRSVSMGTVALSEALQKEHPGSEASTTGPEIVPEARASSDGHVQMSDSHADSGDLSLGYVREGEIGPLQSLQLEVLFSPTIPGRVQLDFHIVFSDFTSKPIPIQVRGVAVSVPVWVVQPSIDLKICMFDRLYQDSIVVQSRASSALRLTFEVCPEMRKHMELLPKTAFIQARSSFNAQLKFLPRSSLSKDAKNLFDSDTGVLEVPMAVQVAGQVTAARFTVHAVVTSSELQFDRTLVDFGFCSVHQSVTSSVRLTNPSLLPQDFGFLAVPERCLLQVTFRPRLPDKDIQEEALRLLRRAELHRVEELGRSRRAEQEAFKEVPVVTGKGKKASVIPKTSQASDGPQPDQLTESPTPAELRPWPERQEEARASLLHSFTGRYRESTVPCFVSDGDPPQDDPQAQPAWSAFNTLYLQLQCPAVQPPLVVISNSARSVIDFHQVAVGERVLKRFTVQNISPETLDLRSSVLDVHGPFSLVKALRCIRPGEKHTVVLAFSPSLEKKYCELLEVCSQKMTLEMTLSGVAVVPAVTSSHPGGVLDFGHVLQKESTTRVLKLQNSSVVAVGFRALLASLSPSRPAGGADSLTSLLRTYTDSPVHPTVGPQNFSGLSVFSVVPPEGSVAPGQSLDITVTFRPDHPSVHYSDRLTVELTNKSKVCVVDVKGAASSHNMYLLGGDVLTVPIESLLPPLTTRRHPLTELELKEKPTTPVLVTLRATYTAGVLTPAVRELQVGCIATQSVTKGGEFHWDNAGSLQQLGFSVEPSKGSVETGHKRTVTVTWVPHRGYKPHEVVQTCLPLTLTGDDTHVYRVTLMALVSTTAD
ncbi:cilia- and flagella-associated protein 74 isoform 8-T9 [Spinachia spinachia]